ncbi:Tigger transposable element-derived protein 1 [Araneus ventricosus]|uniref:Tigger transposable element-derived protein 1 n=1 Tax=Araneus ventricosus TaxID=182803 RepID=A0A4Y2IAY5_ARAVE|nr:Tigger transposable element-derived protein 1 [Araneus ventricosus]
MEKLLMVWVTEKQLKSDTLTQGIICEKARAIYGDLLNQTPRTSTDEASEDSFKASRGWFANFKKRTGIHSVVRHGEAASSDVKAAEDYLKTFSELIEANGYIPQQVFNCDETGLLWKKMPNRTYITAEEKIMPGHKPMKDRLTLALCANASGDCKIKPLLVHHSENPRAFSTIEIKEILGMWERVSQFVEKKHPEKVATGRASELFNDTFLSILQGRKKQTSLDSLFFFLNRAKKAKTSEEKSSDKI